MLVGHNCGAGAINFQLQNVLDIKPTSDLSAGSLAVICAAWDNAAAGGADPFQSISDNKGNTWQEILTKKSGGGANAGMCLRFFASAQENGPLTVNDLVIIQFSCDVVARGFTITEFASDAEGGRAQIAAGSPSGNTFAAAQQSAYTKQVAAGKIILGAIGLETATLPTSTGQNNDGIWVARQTVKAGVGAAGVTIFSQWKLVTADGAQVFSVNFNAIADGCQGACVIEEVLP